jgi:imidazolonepropionase-like amidohydrolase
MKKITLLFSALLLCCIITHAQQTILPCGKLIDVKNKKVLETMSIIITGNKITDVKEGYVQPGPADKLIDLKNYTVMPG